MNPFSPRIDVANLSPLDGFVIEGINPNFANGSMSGSAVSAAGDINGDGFDDFVISAVGAAALSGTGQQMFLAGEVYVVFGTDEGWPLSLDPATLDGRNGFRILGGREGQGLGHSVSSAGDINNDGFDDLLIGTRATSLGQSAEPGEAFVIFGKAQPFDPVKNIYEFQAGEGFQVTDPDPSIPGQLGRSVSNIGDFNGDGFDDFAIGEAKAGNPFQANPETGAVHIIFGGPRNGFPLTGDPFDFPRTVTYYGPLTDAGLGGAVSGIGDFNGDGLDDFIAVAPGAPFRSPTERFATVIFGDATVPASGNFELNLAAMPQDGSVGFLIRNLADAAATAANAGDVNGDGLDDIIVGGPNALGGRGVAYVIYGTETPDFNVDPTALDGSDGFMIRGNQAGGFLGASVHAAGDVNADGFDDVIVGAFGANRTPIPNRTEDWLGGAAYVVFGGPSGGAATVGVGSLNGSNGFVVEGIGPFSVNPDDSLGAAVTGGVDVNGDGIDDIIIGAPGADAAPGSVQTVKAGRTYVIFGRDTDGPPVGVNLRGTDTADELIGTRFDDRIDGRLGDDTVRGGNGNDSLLGAEGADRMNGEAGVDTLTSGSGDDTVSGGTGVDRLTGEAGNDELVGGEGNDTLIGGTGRDRLIGGTGADTQTGGVGADVFVFGAGDGGVAAATRDEVADFSRVQRDRIDLSAIDADPGQGGRQPLEWIGTDAAFTAVGQVRFMAGSGLLDINLDADGAAEIRILLEGVTDFRPASLIL